MHVSQFALNLCQNSIYQNMKCHIVTYIYIFVNILGIHALWFSYTSLFNKLKCKSVTCKLTAQQIPYHTLSSNRIADQFHDLCFIIPNGLCLLAVCCGFTDERESYGFFFKWCTSSLQVCWDLSLHHHHLFRCRLCRQFSWTVERTKLNA